MRCLGRASTVLGPSFVFWTVTYGSIRGFTLIIGLPLGLSLFPDKGKRCPSGKDREVFFIEILNQGVFSVRRSSLEEGGKVLGGRRDPNPEWKIQ